MDEEQVNTDAPYTAREAAKKARVNIKTIYEGVRNGTVPSFRVNDTIRIPRPAFDALLRSGK
jgi:excisionase family DNA binding protein